MAITVKSKSSVTSVIDRTMRIDNGASGNSVGVVPLNLECDTSFQRNSSDGSNLNDSDNDNLTHQSVESVSKTKIEDGNDSFLTVEHRRNSTTCEKLVSKHPDSYASFRVTLEENKFEVAQDVNERPEGALVTRFFRGRITTKRDN
ncbi:hypothetical protein HHI36_012254 [Cryptolaemus montrouzieri]|uniref:Uncharacterized protein n=1 Tax=Cryptolaemus montrouzieri TaxID=559131 RepID=A0ABD2NDN4_9CUCU